MCRLFFSGCRAGASPDWDTEWGQTPFSKPRTATALPKRRRHSHREVVMKLLSTIKGTITAGVVLAIVIALIVAVLAKTGIAFNVPSFIIWLHVLAGVTWIGLLYYFNFVQVPA